MVAAAGRTRDFGRSSVVSHQSSVVNQQARPTANSSQSTADKDSAPFDLASEFDHTAAPFMALRKRAKAINVKSVEQIDRFAEEGKPVLIDFMQFSCPACKAMDGTIDQIAHEFRGSAHVLKVNIARVPGAAQRFKIKGTPTFVLFGTSERSQRKARRRGEEPGTRKAIRRRWCRRPSFTVSW